MATDEQLFAQLQDVVDKIVDNLKNWEFQLTHEQSILLAQQQEINRRTQLIVARSNTVLDQVKSMRSEREEVKKVIAQAEKAKSEAEIEKKLAEAKKFELEENKDLVETK